MFGPAGHITRYASACPKRLQAFAVFQHPKFLFLFLISAFNFQLFFPPFLPCLPAFTNSSNSLPSAYPPFSLRFRSITFSSRNFSGRSLRLTHSFSWCKSPSISSPAFSSSSSATNQRACAPSSSCSCLASSQPACSIGASTLSSPGSA